MGESDRRAVDDHEIDFLPGNANRENRLTDGTAAPHGGHEPASPAHRGNRDVQVTVHSEPDGHTDSLSASTGLPRRLSRASRAKRPIENSSSASDDNSSESRTPVNAPSTPTVTPAPAR